MFQSYFDPQPLAIADGVDHQKYREDTDMKTGNLFVYAIMAGLAVTSSAAVFADSDEHDQRYESSKRYGTEWDDDASAYREQKHENRVLDAYQYGPNTGFQWKITNAVPDHKGRLAMLQHVVPLQDMAVFGGVTNSMIANGLKLERVDAVFNESDAEMGVPHYHFTQRFQVSS